MSSTEARLNPYQSREDGESEKAKLRPKHLLGQTALLVAFVAGAIVYVIRSRDVASVQHTREFITIVREDDLEELELEELEPGDDSIADAIRHFGRGRGGAHVLMDDGNVIFVEQNGKLKPPSSDGEVTSDYGLWGTLGGPHGDLESLR
ncbi:MAG: hypothetical protein AAFU85_34550 [Planctomycetota bacterium]